MIPADCTIIDDDVPCPERYCVQLSHQIISLYEHEDDEEAHLLHLEALLAAFLFVDGFELRGSCCGGIDRVDINNHVGHCK